MAVREIIKNKKYKIELFIGRNGSKKIMHYEIVNGGKKEAELRESELKLQLKNHSFVKNNDKTIKDLMVEYLDYNKDKWSPKTYYSNVYWAENINKALGHIKIQNLNVKMLESFYSNLKNATKEIIDKETNKKIKVKRFAGQTIKHHITLINGALNKAVKWGYINYNINNNIEKPKIRKKQIECYTPEEVEKLINVIKNEPIKYQAIILLALDSGIRRGELTGLTWKDINFEAGSITINKATQYIKGIGIIEKKTKSASSDRTIYLSNTTINVLKNYKLEQMRKKIKLGNRWGNSKRVFTTERGEDMHPDTPSKIFQNIIKRYNLKRITFHGLRHTSISLMISKGIQTQVISKRAGHSSISVTHNTYSHFFDSEFKKCADEMENFLKQAN